MVVEQGLQENVDQLQHCPKGPPGIGAMISSLQNPWFSGGQARP
jgi:hypothetical protein